MSQTLIGGKRVINEDEFLNLVRKIKDYSWGGNGLFKQYMNCRDVMVVSLVYEMGLRLGEIVGLNEDDVTFSDDDSHLTVLVDQKGNTSRPDGFLALPPVRAEIIEYTDLLEQFKETNGTHNNPAFIVDRDGNRIPDASARFNLGYSSEKCAIEARIRGFGFKALRRGYFFRREGKI